MNYIERERQRTEAAQQDHEAAQQEHLDWLHHQHEQLARQTALLERIAKHTTFFYVLTIIWLVLGGIWFLTTLAEAAQP